ncbi:hypothetical protein CEE37_14290 [candidate division LCP-89 bacterium B3_LCP]|uniref:Nucleoside phosphorylase domain-containing protein n=1 Tax=candidate division LCP-89 bacterium B3_LCP TaxID=2012998 RepID=A0A532UQT2_UNCL8|nr:MAG: hypothetical protein CEE37_14290 [candidate division LCP-89 bacterium B3_LCP]
MNIAIAAAHAMEFSTFRRYMGRVRKLPLESWQHYIWENGNNQVILLETGIGPETARGAITALLKTYQIDCIINFGSAGMIDAKLSVGDVYLADEVVSVQNDRLLQTNIQMTEAINAFLTEQEMTFCRGRLLTSPDPVVKKSQRMRLAKQFQVGAVDMETYALAEIANHKRIPFTALKMISDRATAMSRLEFWKNLPHVNRSLGKLMYGFLEFLKAA